MVQGNSVQNGSLGPGEGAPEAREASTSDVDGPVTKSTTQDTMGEDLEQYQTAQSSNHDPPSTTDSIRSNGISTPDQTVGLRTAGDNHRTRIHLFSQRWTP